jgi:uncharacterized membrane protein
MGSVLNFGRTLFAIAIAAFGLQYILFAIGEKGPTPGPPWYPASVGVAWLAAIVLVAVAVGLFVGGAARRVAVLLDAGLSLRILFFHLPLLIAHPRDPGPWTTLFEVLAIAGGAAVLAELSPEGRNSPSWWNRIVNLNARVGVFCIALSLVVFAVQHFMYAQFVATLIPAWIPARLFWAYFTGAAFIAAALAMTTKVMARLASFLLGVMFLLWVLILHGPRVAYAIQNGNEVTSLFVALAMSGIGFILAERFARRRV